MGETLVRDSRLMAGEQARGENAHVCLPVLHFSAESSPAALGGDILDEGDTPRDGLDRDQVDTDDDRVLLRHLLGRDLQPTSRSGTQIDDTFGRGEKVVFAVQLDELEGGTGAVALFSVREGEGEEEIKLAGEGGATGATDLRGLTWQVGTWREVHPGGKAQSQSLWLCVRYWERCAPLVKTSCGGAECQYSEAGSCTLQG